MDALRAEHERLEPDEASLSAARLKLSRASGRRKSFIECQIYPQLHDAPPEAARALSELRQEAARMAVVSSSHIARWTMHQIVKDWAGYKRDSVQLLASISKRIADEAAILYPLLAEREQSAIAI